MSLKKAWPGFLIVFEGIDGAGKSTQVDWLNESLEKEGWEVVRSKEPTNGQFGRQLRESMTKGRLSLEEELELFLKDRREHVETLILSALRGGKVVVIDRYYFSTAAYQGARGVDPDLLLKQNEEFAPEPDLLFFIDVEPAIGLERIKKRGDVANQFEQLATLTRAREIFVNISRPYKRTLDGGKAATCLREEILAETMKILRRS